MLSEHCGRRRLVVLGLVVLSLLVTLLGCASAAQPSYPAKDIELIVPYKPGGGYDLEARLLAPILPKYLPNKVNVIVQNVSGAGGKVGTEQLMKSKPDGYTIGLQDPIVLGVLLARSELGSVTAKDIVPIGRVDAVPTLMAIGTNGKFKSAAEMKGQPIRFGGQTDDILVTKLLGEALNAQPNLITFDAIVDSMLAVARGDADAALGPANSVQKLIRDSEGKLKPALIIGSDSKLAELPDVPTAKSLGLVLDEAVFINSKVVVVPPGTPEDVRKMLAEAVEKATKDADFAAGMNKAGFVPAPLGGADLEKAVSAALEAVKKHEAIMPK